MVNEVSYSTISHVLDSWEALKRTPNYEEVAGSLLFQNLFENSPESKVLFGFPMNIDPSSKDLLQSKRFKMHAVYMIQMLDTALGLLGPDTELLTEVLCELGVKHKRYGVKPEMFAVMGDALLLVFERILGPDGGFNQATKNAWVETYGEISFDMKLGQGSGRFP